MAAQDVLIECKGIQLPKCIVPAFDVHQSDVLHLTGIPSGTGDLEDLQNFLTGRRPHPAMRLHKSAVLAGFPSDNSETTFKYLRRYFKADAEIERILRLFDIDRNHMVGQYGMFPRTLMGLAAAFSTAPIVVYRLVLGDFYAKKAREFVASGVQAGAAIELHDAFDDDAGGYEDARVVRVRPLTS